VRRLLVEAGPLTLGAVLLIWWLLPIYNMLLIALDSQGTTEFAGTIIPPVPSLEAFDAVLFQSYWYLADFWHQFGNSIYIGITTMALNVAIGSAAGFALGRMRLSRGWVSSNAALLVYAVPAYFLVIPFDRLTHSYGLMDNLWSVIAVDVVFGLPCTLPVLQWYGRLIPLELDEAGRIDGASPWQVYRYIYIPLMAPALAAVGTFALLLAWNEYLYQFPAADLARAQNRGDHHGRVFRERRFAMEFHDGGRGHLLPAADRRVLCPAPLHGVGADLGCGEGIGPRRGVVGLRG
jgi:multiple sugar transport system permease protein